MAQGLGEVQKVKQDIYNNFGIVAITLASILNDRKQLDIHLAYLAFPFVSHQKLLGHLSRVNSKVLSLQQLLVEKTPYFVNFNSRYLDSLVQTTNAIQYLSEIGYVDIDDCCLISKRTLDYEKSMGDRAAKIYKASDNISRLLSTPVGELYANLRVEL